MSVINATEMKKGSIIKFNNELLEVVDYAHVAPGNWRAMVQTKLRNVKTNSISEYRFRSNERVELMLVDAVEARYSYQKGNNFVFMNSETYDEIHIDKELVQNKTLYLTTNLDVVLFYCDGEVIDVKLPVNVTMKVTQTDPPLKTATITNMSKPATLDTGLVVAVPAFVEVGEIIKVDTRDGSYVERVKE